MPATRYEAMFTIDLLNGQAIPPRARPGGLVIIAMTAVVPIAVAMGLFITYLNGNVVLSVKEKEIARYEGEIAQLSGEVKIQNALEDEKRAYGKYLSEVKSALGKHTQWSPVLTTLMENIPDSVILTSLAIEHDSVRKTVPKKDDPKKNVEISVPVKILRLGVSGGRRVHDAGEAAKHEHPHKTQCEQHRGAHHQVATPERADPVEDFDAGRDGDGHGEEREGGGGDRAHARGEHVMAPYAETEEADARAGENDDRIAEQRLARKGG